MRFAHIICNNRVPQFRGRKQQDAYQLLRYLLDHANEEVVQLQNQLTKRQNKVNYGDFYYSYIHCYCMTNC